MRSIQNEGVAGLVLGVAALVMGIPAFIVSFVPFLCIVGLVCSLFGLLAGIVGVLVAALQKGGIALGISIAGGTVNLLALLVALFMTIFSVGSSAPSDKSKPQQTAGVSSQELVTGWGRFVDPDGDCSIRRQAGTLTIQIPPTAHDFTPEQGLSNAPRVVQEVQGDFSVQVKVCGTIRPVAAPTVPGHVAFQSGGLLLWSDAGNYVRLERAALNRGGAVQTIVSLEHHINGRMMQPQSANIMEQDIYLRLERHGNQLAGSFSSDGQQWSDLQQIHVPYPAKVDIGVEAVNAAQQALSVRFEDLRITNK